MKRGKRASGLKLPRDARVPRLVCIGLPVYGLVYCLSVYLCISTHARVCSRVCTRIICIDFKASTDKDKHVHVYNEKKQVCGSRPRTCTTQVGGARGVRVRG